MSAPARASHSARAWALLGAAILAGLSAAFAHPPFGFLPGLLGYAGLFWLVDHAAPPRALRSAFFRGWLAGLAYFSICTWWIADAFFVDAKDQAWMAPFAVVLMAGGLALFWAFGALIYRLAAPVGPWRVLVFAGALAGAEWLRGHVLSGFPWDLPGETWRAGSAPSQAASVVGAYGLTWITLAIAAAPGLGWKGRGAQVTIAAAVVALGGLYAAGTWRLAHAVTASAPGAPLVRIVQPDTPERPDYDTAAFADVVHRNLDLTKKAAARTPDIVIWSEAGLPAALEDYLAPGTWTRAAIVAALKPGQILITGGYREDDPAPGQTGPIYRNSLIVLRLTPQGLAPIAAYDKFKLVPFGEYMPRWLKPFGVQELIHVADGFTPGPRPRPLAPAGVPPLQPLICYESLFPGFTSEGAAASGVRPAWIVNISDDAWFGATSGPWQHLNLASYRAIEEGLPMVRATPTGVSAVVDAYGRVIPGKLLGEGAYGAIDAVLPPALAPTPFDRLGRWSFAGLLALSVLLAASGWRATSRRNGKAPQV